MPLTGMVAGGLLTLYGPFGGRRPPDGPAVALEAEAVCGVITGRVCGDVWGCCHDARVGCLLGSVPGRGRGQGVPKSVPPKGGEAEHPTGSG